MLGSTWTHNHDFASGAQHLAPSSQRGSIPPSTLSGTPKMIQIEAVTSVTEAAGACKGHNALAAGGRIRKRTERPTDYNRFCRSASTFGESSSKNWSYLPVSR